VNTTTAVPPAWLDSDEAQVHLRLPSRKALYHAVRRGDIPVHRLGKRRLRFSRAELDAYLGRASAAAVE